MHFSSVFVIFSLVLLPLFFRLLCEPLKPLLHHFPGCLIFSSQLTLFPIPLLDTSFHQHLVKYENTRSLPHYPADRTPRTHRQPPRSRRTQPVRTRTRSRVHARALRPGTEAEAPALPLTPRRVVPRPRTPIGTGNAPTTRNRRPLTPGRTPDVVRAWSGHLIGHTRLCAPGKRKRRPARFCAHLVRARSRSCLAGNHARTTAQRHRRTVVLAPRRIRSRPGRVRNSFSRAPTIPKRVRGRAFTCLASYVVRTRPRRRIPGAHAPAP